MRWIFGLIALLALPAGVWASPLPDGGVTAPEVAAALSKAGYPADVTTDRPGDPLVRSSTGKVLFSVRFYQCGTTLRCGSIQFIAPFRHMPGLQVTVADWNRDSRFGRAFVDRRGNAWISMDLVTSRGMTTEALEANIDRWLVILNGFETVVER